MTKRVLGVFAALAITLAAQTQPARIPSADVPKLIDRTLQLMEAATVVVPGLPQAAGPSIENARQAQINLKITPGNAAHTWAFISAVKSFITIADATPRPFPAPVEAARQFTELRDNAATLDVYFKNLLTAKESQLRSPDRDNLRRYHDDNEKIAAPVPGRIRVVFFGDSITDGWRLNEYFSANDFINRGISGQVTGEMLGRMQTDVIALKPAAMLLLGGTNDLARGTPLATIEANLTSIADLAEFHQIKPMFASVLPVSDYHKDVNPRFETTKVRPPSQILELNRWLKDFCARRKFIYVDYFSALVDKQGFIAADLADDGLHPNAKGYRLMAPIAQQAIETLLKTSPAKKRKGAAGPGKEK